MSKALIIADVHICDYAQRNPSSRFRLYQGSRVVAQNIIDQGKKNGCDYIIFAGDIIEKSVIRPYVQAEVKLFLDTVMANFKEGWLIYGNHDIDNKSSDQALEDSCLSVMLPNNLYYADKKAIQIENTTVAFNNWQPEFDLSWIKEKVDLLITHATICYNQEAEGLYKSQELDESKFDLAICGDIHRRGQIGKYVSIGVPQRGKLGDSDESSGVVYDFVSKSWCWVNLNPYDNLMKFEYTSDLNKEGWDENTHTWFVYKQDGTGLLGNRENIKVDAWEEINSLITDALSKSGLQKVHNEVLKSIKDIDSNEVDFNFTLLKLRCKNWRSIDEAELNFENGDKIFIQGANGSGKSSLLSALKYAFVDVGSTIGLSSLKPFIRFGQDYCFTEVTFLYQGNVCKILRGTKEYGLWINDEPQKYSDKRSFEKDVRERFPFIEYMDAFILDADHNQFLGSLTPERVTEITSKFLKLDRLDTYCETAKLLSEQFKKNNQVWEAKIKEVEKLIGYIDEKLNTIVIPSISKQELEIRRQEGLDMQRKNAEWNKFINTTAQLQAQIQTYTEKLKDLSNEKLQFRSIHTIDSELSSISQELQSLQVRSSELGNIGISISFKQQELERLKTEGNNAYIEARNIGLGKKCASCGQVIQNTEAIENHRRELLQKVESLKPTIFGLQQEINQLLEQQNNSSQELLNIKERIGILNQETSKRLVEKSHQSQIENEITKYTNLLSVSQNKLNSLGVVEKVELPENFMEIMNSISENLTTWSIYETNMNDRCNKQMELDSLRVEYNKTSNCLGELDSYIKLTGPIGIIQEEIMEKLKNEFSSNQVRYVVTRKGKGNKEHLSLMPEYNNNGNFVSYGLASSGQRTLLDLDFLSKIVTRLGLLVMDEFLKCLDPQKTEQALELINNLNVGCTFITSHMESIGAFYNKSCSLYLDDSNTTRIDFR